MTTIELLTILQEQFKGWNTDGERGILPHLNAAHFMLMASESEQNVYFDESNGGLPTLATTENVYSYTCDDNLWKLGGIYVRVEDAGDYSGPLVNTTGLDYGNNRHSQRPIEYLVVAGRQYVRVPYVRSWPATESANARLMFNAQPQTTTGYYRQYGWRKPTQIISETIELDIPPPWDYQYLLPATAKLIESIQHGNYMESRQYVLGVLKPALQKDMNGGEQGFDYEPDDRGF